MSFETCYLHLSKIEVRPGEHVAQKTVIAESGNTGRLTTGPHLHFGLKRGGVWVNPLNQNFPRADPLPRALLPRFRERVAELQARLENLPLASRAQTLAPTP
jgi:murein DD-endopeptidase MepM/ murein hydrolase activator NlpD